jgi:hypothetical protein
MNESVHKISVKYSSDRKLGRNAKTGQTTKTIGWDTRCSCGAKIETKGNNKKAHVAKVAKHAEQV